MKISPSHILLKHEYEAKDIYKWLQEGKEFSALARKYSQCSSYQSGGDLGEVEEQRLDDDFVAAFHSLKPGEYTIPVRTRFGWHIIKRNK